METFSLSLCHREPTVLYRRSAEPANAVAAAAPWRGEFEKLVSASMTWPSSTPAVILAALPPLQRDPWPPAHPRRPPSPACSVASESFVRILSGAVIEKPLRSF